MVFVRVQKQIFLIRFFNKLRFIGIFRLIFDQEVYFRVRKFYGLVFFSG